MPPRASGTEADTRADVVKTVAPPKQCATTTESLHFCTTCCLLINIGSTYRRRLGAKDRCSDPLWHPQATLRGQNLIYHAAVIGLGGKAFANEENDLSASYLP